jgi:hypothetical protein
VGRHGFSFSCHRFRETEEYVNLRNEALASRINDIAVDAHFIDRNLGRKRVLDELAGAHVELGL